MSYDERDRKYYEMMYLRKYNNVNTYLHYSLNIEDIKSVEHLNDIIKKSSKKPKTYRLNRALTELAEQAIRNDPRFSSMTELIETLIYNFLIDKVMENKKNAEIRIREIETINYENVNKNENNKFTRLPQMLENIYENLKAGINVIYNPEKNIPILIEITKRYVGIDKRAEELLRLLENYPKGEKNEY